jgi:hypothetical protein
VRKIKVITWLHVIERCDGFDLIWYCEMVLFWIWFSNFCVRLCFLFDESKIALCCFGLMKTKFLI